MGVIGRDTDAVPAVVRYVEIRCLLGGTTTSQGVALASNTGIVKHFRGLVRNVEATGDAALPPAATHIADVDATDAEHFLARISGKQKLILHLAEGTQESARQHFLALQVKPDRWAITENLIGIHCVGLTADDFAVFGAHGGSMVWSPLSNLLLYGQTAAARRRARPGRPGRSRLGLVSLRKQEPARRAEDSPARRSAGGCSRFVEFRSRRHGDDDAGANARLGRRPRQPGGRQEG